MAKKKIERKFVVINLRIDKPLNERLAALAEYIGVEQEVLMQVVLGLEVLKGKAFDERQKVMNLLLDLRTILAGRNFSKKRAQAFAMQIDDVLKMLSPVPR